MYGGDPTIRDHVGKMPIEYAQSPDIISLLDRFKGPGTSIDYIYMFIIFII